MKSLPGSGKEEGGTPDPKHFLLNTARKSLENVLEGPLPPAIFAS